MHAPVVCQLGSSIDPDFILVLQLFHYSPGAFMLAPVVLLSESFAGLKRDSIDLALRFLLQS